MNRISTFAFAFTAALFAFHGARAATSIPAAEAGFALASNGGSDAIATPMSSDMGGGTSRAERSSEVAVETPDRDVPKPDTAAAPGRDEHAQKAAPGDTSNSSTTTRKSRGNAHWQALLPGLMR